MKAIAIKPKMSEKAYGLSEALNTYVFEIPAGVNKQEISSAVAKQYTVNIVSVRLAKVRGKPMRTYRRRAGRAFNSRRGDTQKAYVTLKQGDKLPIFAAIEEEAKKAEAKEKK